jgi:hypothetical protein
MSVTINGTDNSASLPALVGSDTDTGVFFPAANTMAFSTGGAEKMRVDASGNVLIGKTSSYRSGKLVVATANVSQTSTLANLHITTTDTQAVDVGGSLGLGGQVGGDETPFGLVSGRKENGTSGNYAGYLAFATQNSSAAVAERMRIGSTGAITTSNPNTGVMYPMGFCRAWAVFGSSSTTTTFNVSSITTTATGQYTLNFTSNVAADGNYAVFVTTDGGVDVIRYSGISGRTASTVSVVTTFYSGTFPASYSNLGAISVAVMAP